MMDNRHGYKAFGPGLVCQGMNMGTGKCVKSAQIDGVTLKADTFYALKNGEFVKVD